MIRVKVFERDDFKTAVKVHDCFVLYRGVISVPGGDVAFYVQGIGKDGVVVEYEEQGHGTEEAWEEFVKWTLSLGKNIIGGLIQ